MLLPQASHRPILESEFETFRIGFPVGVELVHWRLHSPGGLGMGDAWPSGFKVITGII